MSYPLGVNNLSSINNTWPGIPSPKSTYSGKRKISNPVCAGMARYVQVSVWTKMEEVHYRGEEEVKVRAVMTTEICFIHGVLPVGLSEQIRYASSSHRSSFLSRLKSLS